MKLKIALLLVFICVLAGLQAQDKSAFKKEVYISGNDTLPYRILLPLNYDATKKYPIIYFLHGAGERGNDNEAQLTHGSSLFLRDSIRQNYPAIVVFPQCPAQSFWSNVKFTNDSVTKAWQFHFQVEGEPTIAMKLAQELLKKLMNDYPVNKKQVYITGLSMGGMGTFEIVRRNPTLFAAAMPICGGAEPSTALKLTKTKWWVFHGDADNVVPEHFSKDMVDALKAAGADVKYSVYPGVGHNSWDNAFAEPGFLAWMFRNKK